MVIQFKGSSAQSLVDHLDAQLTAKRLNSLVSTTLTDDQLVIIIRKFGTSKLRFAIREIHKPDSELSSSPVTQVSLIDKKITFTHRPIEADLVAKLQKIIIRLGGEVIAPYVV